MSPRDLYGEEHEIFRESVRRYVAAEITPYHEQWEKDGLVPREAWLSAGKRVCCSAPCRRNMAAAAAISCIPAC